MNKDRRRFLKYLLLGLGVLPLIKVWDSQWFAKLNSGDQTKSQKSLVRKRKISQEGRFNIVEEGDKLVFYNERGKRIFILTEQGEIVLG